MSSTMRAIVAFAPSVAFWALKCTLVCLLIIVVIANDDISIDEAKTHVASKFMNLIIAFGAMSFAQLVTMAFYAYGQVKRGILQTRSGQVLSLVFCLYYYQSYISGPGFDFVFTLAKLGINVWPLLVWFIGITHWVLV